MVEIIKKNIYQFLFIALIVGGYFSVARGQLDPDAEIDFFIDWKTDSYVPLEYEGKTLPAYGSKITLSATPLTPINENDFEYNWIIDLASIPENNGKPIVSFSANKTGGAEHSALLTVYDKKTRRSVKEVAIVIPIANPQSIAYKEFSNGLTIPLNTENAITAGEQINLIVKPFFFNKLPNSQSLNYQWKINNKKVEGVSADPTKLSIDFPKEIPLGMQYSLNLLISNPFDAFQFAEKKYKITTR